MKTKLLLIIALLICKSSIAQKEANIWCFGENAGLDFNSGSPVPFSGSAINQWEGCASIADANGNLLCYTDGITVWNSNHMPMPNGTGLLGSLSSTQSAMIIKQPGSANIYFIFTTGDSGTNPFCYSIADMSLQGGLGDITVLNTQLLPMVDEKLTAVRHANGTDIWVITTQNSMDTIQAFLLTSTGVSATPVTSVSSIIHSGGGEIGCLKASPLKNKLALVNHINSFELHDFDNATGIASNGFEMASANYGAAYGVEFSPDGTRLYGSGYGSGDFIYQFDLTAGSDTAISNSATLVANTSGYATTMQIGPDHKVYTAGGWGSSFVGVINFPDLLGAACNYVDNAISLSPATCNSALPNIFVDIFNTTGVDEMQSANEGFAVYPNPAAGNLTVTFNSSKKSVASIELINILGEMILQQRLDCKPGANKVELENNTLSKGIYFLRLKKDGKIFSKKLTVN